MRLFIALQLNDEMKEKLDQAEKSPLQEDPELYQNSKWSKY